jgi:general secretion pathway protein A
MAFSPKRQEQLSKLGLLEDPFTTSADPRFMYLSEQHAQVMHEARDVVEAFRGLAVVEGSLGVGKSTIARSLDNIYRDQPDAYRVVYVHSAGWESEYAGLLEITSALKLPRRKGSTAQWNELDGFLVEEHRRGRNIVLILDDGQLMAPRSMRLIHRLYNFDLQRKLAQIVVFGQPEIRYLFDAHPEVRSRVDSWLEIQPLDLPDTAKLILHRCRVAGRENTILSRDGVVEVYGASRGVPREIVSVCSKLIDTMVARGETKTASEVSITEAVAVYKRTRLSPPVPAERAAEQEA